MKFAATLLALVFAAVTAAKSDSDSVLYETETVTKSHSTDVTITSCADNKCTATAVSMTTTVVTATVDGVKTVYTTVCPLSETPAANAAPSSSSDDITYVDVTTTPTVTVSTGIESTVYAQSTYTSCYKDECLVLMSKVFTTVVKTTVSGVETVYTTVCPLTEKPSTLTGAATSPKALNAAPSSSIDEITYVDITSTPTITASTGIESTVYAQSTFTSVHQNSTTAAPSVKIENNASKNVALSLAGLIGFVALLV